MRNTETPLSRRQHEVLQLIAEGHDTQSIAKQLCCAVGTVNWHRSQMIHALGARNGAQAVAIGFREGLIK